MADQGGAAEEARGVVAVQDTVAAALGFHHDLADQNQLIHFLKNIAITGGLLQVVAFGAGSFSLDGRRRGAATAGVGHGLPAAGRG